MVNQEGEVEVVAVLFQDGLRLRFFHAPELPVHTDSAIRRAEAVRRLAGCPACAIFGVVRYPLPRHVS